MNNDEIKDVDVDEYGRKILYLKSFFTLVIFYFVGSLFFLFFAYLLITESAHSEFRRSGNRIMGMASLLYNIICQMLQIKNYHMIIDKGLEIDTKGKRIYIYFSLVFFIIISIIEGWYLWFTYIQS